MKWQPDKYQPLRDAFNRGDVDPEVKEELNHHIAMRVAENLAAGMTPAEAEQEARRRFGDLDRYQEETRRVEQGNLAAAARTERWGIVGQEIKRAWRALVRVPSFSVTAIATLSIGIGATAAIFAMLDAVVLRPLSYPAADRLVRIYHPVPKVGPGERWNISQAEYFHFTKEAKRLDAVGLYSQARLTVMAEGEAIPLPVAMVTASTLSMLGVTPRQGRLFTAAESERGAAAVVLLSESFWRSQFGSSPSAIGSTIRIEGTDATIVGVVAAGVDLPDWRADLWLPSGLDPKEPPHNAHTYWAIGRLRVGETLESATAELRDMVSTYSARFPTAYQQSFFAETGFTTTLVRWKDDVVGDANQILWILFGAIAVVLLIASFNVGNLFVVRNQLGKKEMALRAALGAGRWHLMWHHLAESGVVCLTASLLGIGVAKVGLGVLVGALSAHVSQSGVPAVPRLAEIGLGASGVGLALGLGLLATLVFGLGPAFAAPLADQALRQGGRGLTQSRRESAVRAGLVVAQITFAVVLLAAAGLMLQTFQNLRSVEPGFEPSGVMAVDVALPFNRYGEYPKTVAFYRRLVDQVKTIPAVKNTAIGSEIPIAATDGCSTFEYVDRPPDVPAACIQNAIVGPGYFTTLGIPLRGRDLTWEDLDSQTGGALVSDVLAKRLWPGAEPLNRAVNGPNEKTNPPYRVVGVSQGLRWRGLDKEPVEIAFLPLAPIPKTWLWYPLTAGVLIVKTAGIDGSTIVPSIRRFAKELDPEVAISNYRTMDQVVTNSLLRVRVMMTLLIVASVVAVFLSVVGLYGVIAYLVNRRTQEIGIRIALGARAASVRGQVVGQAIRLAGLGLALGVVGGVALTRALAGVLYGVSPGDPLTLGLAAGILLVVAMAASLAPAHRATRIDPLEALRAE